MTVSFSIHDVDKIDKWLRKSTTDAVRKGITSCAFRVLGEIVNNIIPHEKLPPVFDGYYRAAWQVEVTEQGADIVNTLPYAAVVEWGARAENIKIGRAMIQALTEWARRKLGAEKPEQVAWAIAKAMQGFGQRAGGYQAGIFNRDGQEGLRIGERAAKLVPRFLDEEIKRELERAGH